MGTADIIPGVSGGTMALILGLYEKLIESLSRLSVWLILPAWRFVKNPGWNSLTGVSDGYQRIHLPFLTVLVAGILTAVVLGSLVIPPLLADYPVPVRGFFFGLILGSVWIPFTLLNDFGTRSILSYVVMVVLLGAAGYFLTGPDLSLPGTYRWVSVRSSGETLGQILKESPSARPPNRVFWNLRNRSLRKKLFMDKPRLASRLQNFRQRNPSNRSVQHYSDPVSDPYESLTVPVGLWVDIPKLSLPFVFLAAFVAISAMILPGISGSYILLILGSYFYVTSTLRSFIYQLFNGAFPDGPFLTLVVFVGGLITGLILLTRVLSYLLNHWRTPTVGGLTGLMVGCLRGVWPFRHSVGGRVVNVVPGTLTPAVQAGLVLMGIGFLGVLGLSYFANWKKNGSSSSSRFFSSENGLL